MRLIEEITNSQKLTENLFLIPFSIIKSFEMSQKVVIEVKKIFEMKLFLLQKLIIKKIITIFAISYILVQQ